MRPGLERVVTRHLAGDRVLRALLEAGAEKDPGPRRLGGWVLPLGCGVQKLETANFEAPRYSPLQDQATQPDAESCCHGDITEWGPGCRSIQEYLHEAQKIGKIVSSVEGLLERSYKGSAEGAVGPHCLQQFEEDASPLCEHFASPSVALRHPQYCRERYI